MLLLIVGFYIISRTLSIITVVANYSQVDVKVFWYKIIFHFVNMFTLIIALPAIKKDKQKIVIGVIVYNLVVNIIFNQIISPNNVIIALIMLLLQLIFIQMIFYLLFHSSKVSMFILIASTMFVILYYMLIGEIYVDYDKYFSLFLFAEILYGLLMVGVFLQILSKEYHEYLRFIKGLLYVDYNLSLPNEKQLEEDFSNLIIKNEEVNVVGLYIVNLLQLNRQIGYENIQKELLKRIEEIIEEIKENSKLYKWEGPVFVFYSKLSNEKLYELINRLEKILNRPVRYRENTISFKMNALGTRFPYDGVTIDSILENLRTIKYSFLREYSDKNKIY